MKRAGIWMLLAVAMVMMAFPALARGVVIVRGGELFEQIDALKTSRLQLEREFAPQGHELRVLGMQLAALDAQVAALRARNAPQSEIAPRAAEMKRLGADYAAKQEAVQAAYQRRYQSVVTPIQEKVQRGLGAYLAANGMDVDVIDADQAQPGQIPLGTRDVTLPFATWFNAQR